MKTENILLCDYLSTFTATDFAKYLRNYIRIKETDKFNEEMARHEHTQNMVVQPENNQVNFNMIRLDRNYFSHEFDQNTSFSNYENYEQDLDIKSDFQKVLWKNLVATLDYCRDNNRIRQLFANCNRIIKLHIDNKLFIDPQCISILLSCTKPKLVAQVFDKNLIRTQHLPNLSLLFGHFFCSLQCLNFAEYVDLLIPFMASLTVFLYKVRCKKSTKAIIRSLYELAVFVNVGSNRLNRMNNWTQFQTTSIQHLLKSVYLNGVFSKGEMNEFLSFKGVKVPMSVDSEDDEWPIESDTEDELDENNNQASGLVPFGERVQSLANSPGIDGMFVMSLKNLARIQVKESMVVYDVKSVNKLGMLPRELKRFVLFDDEIKAVHGSCA